MKSAKKRANKKFQANQYQVDPRQAAFINERWGTVYVVRCEHFFKIGYTSRFQSRLNNLQSGNPFKIEPAILVRVPNPQVLESELHSQFAAKRSSREWFELSENDMHSILDLIGNRYPTITSSLGAITRGDIKSY